jgi:hypothetical protein
MQIDTTPAPITVLSGAVTSGRTEQIDIRPEATTTFDDVLSAVNPLNYIPVVSDLVGGTAPAAGKIAVGALMGGPFGLIAGIASAIFEAEMGQSPVEAVVAALTGDGTDTPTQLAAREEPVVAQVGTINDADAVAAAPAIPVHAVEQLVENTASATTPAAAVTASAISRLKADAGMTASLAAKDKAALLSLYGESGNSAHQSYKKAQLLPYLRDVGTSKLL